MLRTQIYLPEDTYQRLLWLKESRGLPMAEIIRQALDQSFIQKNEKGNDLFKLADLKFKGGPRNLSTQFNKYLWLEK
jgi:hypothetical protein